MCKWRHSLGLCGGFGLCVWESSLRKDGKIIFHGIPMMSSFVIQFPFSLGDQQEKLS